MTIVKPMRLGLLTRAQQNPPDVYFFVTALGFFDLLDPGDFDLETKMWPAVTAALGETPLDVGMPKARGEVVVVGEAAAPGGQPVSRMEVGFAVGPVRKRMLVFGDRHWRLTDDGPVFDRPEPFERMPLTWDRAFGGPDFADNPFGTGHLAQVALADGRPARLPNIEDADNPVLNIEQTVAPTGCALLDVMAPVRQRCAGTYDASWLRSRFPGPAKDFDWAFYNTAPPDQRLPGFLAGDEAVLLTGMHPEHETLRSRLPGMRVRAFVNLERDGGRTLTEVDMRCETLVLFPGQLKGVLVYRGGTKVADIDGKDVVDTLLAYERLDEPPRDAEHYARTLKARTDPETAALSFFDEKPLRPDIPEVELAEREAEREAAASERDEKWEKRIVASVAAAYRAAGAVPPPASAIPKPDLPVRLPTITPGDIERMDVDMVGLAKSLNELKAYGDAQIAALRREAASSLNQLAGTLDGPGGRMVDAGTLGRIRAAAKAIPLPAGGIPADPPPGSQPAEMPGLEAVQEALAGTTLGDDKDAFEDLVSALEAVGPASGPLTDQEKETLRARAEGRGGDPAVAAALADLDSVDLTAGGQVDDTTPTPPDPDEPDTVDALLAKLGMDSLTGGAGASVDAVLKGLGPQADLVKPILAAKPPEGEADDADPMEKAKAALEEAGPKLEEAFSGARRISPEPLAPLEPLTAEAADYLGAAVRDCLAAGGDFAGRDWAGAALTRADFSGLDLRDAKFEGADLTDAVFAGANLEGAVFTGATLTRADLSNCAMRGANLAKVEAGEARLAGSDLTDALLMNARLAGADLSGATVENATALNADLSGADLSRARLAKVMFMTATLDEAVLAGTEFSQCIFLQAAMNRLSARGVVFRRCALVDCKAADGDFTGGTFSDTGSVGGTVYDRSILRDLIAVRSGWNAASMVGVDLRAARLDGSDLGMADLTGARLGRASLRGAVLVETVMAGADATAATFLQAVMRRVDMRGASLRNANLYRANLDEMDLTYCDLTGVNGLGTNLMRAADVAG